MKNLQFKLSKDVLKKDHKWLKRDFKKDEIVYLYTGYTYYCIREKGLACSLDGNMPFFELPATALFINYQGKEYSVFMTETGSGYSMLYCRFNGSV